MASIVAMAVVPMAMGDNFLVPDTDVIVNNLPPYVCDKWEEPDDDPLTEGIQISPNQFPNVKVVTIEACVCDPNGNEGIVGGTAVVTGPLGFTPVTVTLTRHSESDADCVLRDPCPYTLPCIQYAGTFNMQPWDPEGEYTVSVTATDGELTSEPRVNYFDYLFLRAMTATHVNFGSLDPGATAIVTSTVTVFGNEDIRFVDTVTAGYDDPDDNDGIAWSALTSGALTPIPDGQITTTWDPAVCISGCAAAGMNFADVPFTLVVPVPQAVGAYEGTITFTPSNCLTP